MMSPNQITGFNAEAWTFNQLHRLNYEVSFPPDWKRFGYDLKVGSLPIEVKVANVTTRRNKYRRWQWHIHPTTFQMAGDYALVLIAIYNGEFWPYIIPGSMVNDRTHIQLTSPPPVYAGWLAPFLNRWEIIDYLNNGVYRNGGPLFWQWLSQQNRVMQ